MINAELIKDYDQEKLEKAVQAMKASGWSDETINDYLARVAQTRAVLKALTEDMKEGET